MPGQNLLLGELDVGLDTYLIIPASSHTCLAEIQNLEAWADRNFLNVLNLTGKNLVKLYSSDPSQTGILKYLHPLFKDLM